MTHEQLEANGLCADESLRRYLDDIRDLPLLSRDEETELARRARAGDQRARARLVQANLRFVVSVAKRYQHRGLSLVDLIAEGNLGLVKAVDRFDETLGYKFISYAVWWIRQAIILALSRQVRPMRLPAGRANLLFRLERLHGRLEQERGGAVSWTDLADESDAPEDDVEEMLALLPRVSSLDTITCDEVHLADVVADSSNALPSDELEDRTCLEELARALDGLDRRERSIVTKFFGIGMDERLTLEQIGEEFQLTRERIRQIKDRALKKLRHFSRSHVLREYLAA